MSKVTTLKIGNREVKSTDLTYEDLISLYQQYIDIYGEIPLVKDCIPQNNLPTNYTVVKILKKNNIKYKDFILSFNPKTFEEKQIEKIKNYFPVKIKNIEYDIFGDVYIHREEGKQNKYYINLIDNLGYKYSYHYTHVINAVRRQKNMTRFYKSNKFTYENINHYCKINNIDLFITEENMPQDLCSDNPINFTDSEGNVVVLTWNRVISHRTKRTNADGKIKLKNCLITSKEDATRIILQKQKELDRPVSMYDFMGVKTNENEVNISVIMRLWGSFTNMLTDLELERPLTHEEIMLHIKNVCENVKQSGRKTIILKDFQNIKNAPVADTLRRHCNMENIELEDLIKSYGCELQHVGLGVSHKFEDGEKTISSMEYEFTTYIRSLGYVYNKDYYRDVLYKDFSNEKSKMNCDYKIMINEVPLYVEIAGLLYNCVNENWKEHDFTSKIEKQYKKKMLKKEQRLIESNNHFLFIISNEMYGGTYKEIFQNKVNEILVETA